MNLPGQESIPNPTKDRGIVLGEAIGTDHAEPLRRKNEVGLEIDRILDDKVMRGILSDWLIPTIVDRLIAELTNSTERDE